MNQNVPVTVLESAEDFSNGLDGVGSGAAVDPRMQVDLGAFDHQFSVDNAAQADAQRGQLGREHFGVADDGGVRFEVGRLAADILLDVLAAYLLFPFDQEADVHRKLAFGLHQAADRAHQDVGLSFVVAGAAGVDIVVAN